MSRCVFFARCLNCGVVYSYLRQTHDGVAEGGELGGKVEDLKEAEMCAKSSRSPQRGIRMRHAREERGKPWARP